MISYQLATAFPCLNKIHVTCVQTVPCYSRKSNTYTFGETIGGKVLVGRKILVFEGKYWRQNICGKLTCGKPLVGKNTKYSCTLFLSQPSAYIFNVVITFHMHTCIWYMVHTNLPTLSRPQASGSATV